MSDEPGYRVRVEEGVDPLAIDRERCRSQHFQVALASQGVITLMTAGLWLPFFVVWLATSGGRVGKLVDGSAVEVSRGRIVVGNGASSRTVPLDAIADIAVADGITVVSIRGAQPLRIFGLADPWAAAAAILEARDAHLGTVRGGAAASLEDDPVETDVATGRRRSR